MNDDFKYFCDKKSIYKMILQHSKTGLWIMGICIILSIAFSNYTYEENKLLNLLSYAFMIIFLVTFIRVTKKVLINKYSIDKLSIFKMLDLYHSKIDKDIFAYFINDQNYNCETLKLLSVHYKNKYENTKYDWIKYISIAGAIFIPIWNNLLAGLFSKMDTAEDMINLFSNLLVNLCLVSCIVGFIAFLIYAGNDLLSMSSKYKDFSHKMMEFSLDLEIRLKNQNTTSNTPVSETPDL
jgi:hypothetical protein